MRITLRSCNGVERERPIIFMVAVAMSLRGIVDSDPAISAVRRALSLVDTAKVVGHPKWWKAVTARWGLCKLSLAERRRRKGNIAVSQ